MDTSSEERTLVVYGGMFDPPHLGHAAIVRTLVERGFDVLVVPAGRPPHRAVPVATDEQRLSMCEAAFGSNSRVRVEACEIVRSRQSGEPTWMSDTLAAIVRTNPGRTVALAIGADQLARFQQWNRWREILELVGLVVIARPDQIDSTTADELVRSLIAESPGAMITWCDAVAINAESGVIRDLLARGQRELALPLLAPGIDHLVDEAYGTRVG